MERCYQKTKNFERLSFLYLITGNMEKLKKMATIAEKRGDAMSRFHNALYLGDEAARGRILSEVGLDALAYVAAKKAGDEAGASKIAAQAGVGEKGLQGVQEAASSSSSSKLHPPTVVNAGSAQYNWPTTGTTESYFDKALVADVEEGGTIFKDNAVGQQGEHDVDGWLEGDDFVDAEDAEDEVALDGCGAATSGTIAAAAADEGAWDLEEDDAALVETIGGDAPVVAPLSDLTALEGSLDPGSSEAEHWLRNSPIAADHAAAGSFDTAMTLLARQAGIIDFTPLKPHFLACYQGARAYLPGAGAANLPALEVHLRRNASDEAEESASAQLAKSLPVHARTIHSITAGPLQEAYKLINTNKLPEAEPLFRSILLSLVLTVGTTAEEGQEILDLIVLCREYLLGIAIELSRRSLVASEPENIARHLELAALFTHAGMQPAHRQLALRAAMNEARKAGNMAMAAGFARRLLELGPSPKVEQVAQSVLTAAERAPRDTVPVPGYDPHDRHFVICAGSHRLIPGGGIGGLPGGGSVQEDPLTGAKYLPEFKGQRCRISGVSEVGGQGSGLRCWI